MTPVDLSAFVKAYDVRGLVGTQLTDEVVTAIGAAFADELADDPDASADASGARRPVVVGHDMRDSSPGFAQALTAGILRRGVDVVAIGLVSTDECYYASGALDAPAAMFTASHNPATYNGIKLSRAGARAISSDTGLTAVRDRAQRYLESGIPASPAQGSVSTRDVLGDYAAHLRAMVPLEDVRPLRIVVDAANGMAGLTVPAVLGTAAGLPALPIEVIPMYFELDGTFPNHDANPLDPANLADVQAAVLEQRADLGLAFDGDADRCFVIDERGEPVGPSAVAAVVALREIARAQAAGEERPVVLHNLITSRVVPETVRAAGAEPVRTRVGHSYIKDVMAQENAVFGGEHSAHYYFRDFWGADNGMLAAMHVIAELGARQGPLSELGAAYTPYSLSGELNSVVDDVPAAYTRIVEEYTGEAAFDELDGLTVTGQVAGDQPWWWANIRPSNTEPLLRLNVEARDRATMEAVRNRMLALIRS